MMRALSALILRWRSNFHLRISGSSLAVPQGYAHKSLCSDLKGHGWSASWNMCADVCVLKHQHTCCCAGCMVLVLFESRHGALHAWLQHPGLCWFFMRTPSKALCEVWRVRFEQNHLTVTSRASRSSRHQWNKVFCLSDWQIAHKD